MKILVIGANGFIGKKLTTTLSKSHEMVSWSSKEGSGIDPETGLLRPDTEIPEGLDLVIYASQSPFYREMPERASHLMSVNATTPLEVALRALKKGCRKMIYFSTGNVYSAGFEPISEDSPQSNQGWYAHSKITGEKSLDLLRKEMQICHIRPFGVFGPGQSGMLIANLIQRVGAGDTVTVDKKKQETGIPGGLKVSFVYVDDAVRVLCNLIAQDSNDWPESLNLAGLKPYCIREVVEVIGEVLAIEPKIEENGHIRSFDLISDTTKMMNYVDFEMTPLKKAIKLTTEG